MAHFRVVKSFYYGHLDSVLLSGTFEGTEPVGEGWTIDLPAAIKGSGPVPIKDLRSIQFADGTESLCLVLAYEVFYDSPLLEFRDLEGLDLALAPIN